MSDKRLRILSPDRRDAAFYYRVSAPFSILRYTSQRIWDVGMITPDAASRYDILWLQQTIARDEYIVARDWKEAGRKVVYDVDDWFLEHIAFEDGVEMLGLPPSWSQISPDHISIHKRCLKLADVVTTTTTALSDKLSKLFQGKVPVTVLPNCIKQADFEFRPMAHNMDGPVLAFLGVNPWDDLVEISRDIDVALNEVNGHLLFVGPIEAMACFPRSLIERTLHNPVVRPHEMKRVFQMVAGCDAGLAWATDKTEVSRMRSPLRLWQFGACGLPVVASKTVYGGYTDNPAVRIVDGRAGLAEALWNVLRVAGRKAQGASGAGQDEAGSAENDKLKPLCDVHDGGFRNEVFARHSYEQCALGWERVAEYAAGLTTELGGLYVASNWTQGAGAG